MPVQSHLSYQREWAYSFFMKLPQTSTVILGDQRRSRSAGTRYSERRMVWRKKWALVCKHKYLYLLFLTPAVITALLFQYRPMVGVIMAFQKFDIAAGSYLSSPFVGLENFRTFLVNPRFYQALRNTLGLSLMSLGIVFPLPIIFALCLNEVRNMGARRVIQTITYLPHFISWVVVAAMVYKLLDPSTGIANTVITALGGRRCPLCASRAFSGM